MASPMTPTTPRPILDAAARAIARSRSADKTSFDKHWPTAVEQAFELSALYPGHSMRGTWVGDAYADAEAALSIAEAALAQRDARIAELREALRPYARWAADWRDEGPDEDGFDEPDYSLNGDEHAASVSDLRRAARVLASHDQDGEAGR